MSKSTIRLPIFGFCAIIASYIYLYFGVGALQSSFGLYGLILSELGFLAIAVLFCVISKSSPKKVFPINTPSIKGIFGTILLWFCVLIISLSFVLLLYALFPERTAQTVTALDGLTSGGALLVWISAALFPAVCEEALFRGFLLFSFKDTLNDVLLTVGIGIVFGIFHSDIIRFFPTAILGGAITYIMLKTKNILYPMLFHLLNNSFSTLIGGINTAQSQSAAELASDITPNMYLASMGAIFTVFFYMPIVFFLAVKMIKYSKEKIPVGSIANGIVPYAIASFALLVCGIILVAIALIPHF